MRRIAKLALAVFALLPSVVTSQTPSSVEETIIARSLRTARVMPTEFCAENKVGFAQTTNEDTFTFHAVAIRPTDGKVANVNGRPIGHLRACFGRRPTL
jgi:hypothetical protein